MGTSALAALSRIPALVVLQRLPTPAIALRKDGSIPFANGAFRAMIGQTCDESTEFTIGDVFRGARAGEDPVAFIERQAGLIVELRHADGYVVRARTSRSVLLRREDPIAVTTFDDRTDALWADG